MLPPVRTRRLSPLLILAALIAALVVAPSASAGRDRCTARGAKTVKQNAQVRVFRVKDGRSTDYYACLRGGSARPVFVGNDFSEDEDLSSSRVITVLVAGTSAAAHSNDFSDIGPEGSESESVVVVDLRRGGRYYSRTIDTTDGPYGGFGALRLRRDGAAAWALTRGLYTELDVLAPESGRPVPVAFAKEITTLAFGGDGVTWKQDGATRTAAIADGDLPGSPASPGAGKVDGGYGRCGVVAPPKPAADAAPAGMVRLADGGMLAIGVTGDTASTVKLRPDGQVDTSFGSGGQVSATLPGFTQPFDDTKFVVPQPDGRILVVGRSGEASTGQAQAAVARLNPDGTLDASFGSGGSVLNAIPGGMRSQPFAADVDSAGRILLAGQRDGKFVVARLSPSGAPDSSWGTGGVAQIDFPGVREGEASSAGAVRALPGGGVLVGGFAEETLALARLTDGGTPDPAFGAGGLSVASPPAAASATVIELLPDGRFLVAGPGDNVNGGELFVARFAANGQPDPSFGRGGFALGTNIGAATQLFLSPGDGTILAVGRGFTRLSADGVFDPSFGVGGAFSSFTVGGAALQADGSAIGVAGRNQARMAFQRYALGGPALAALEQQHAVCRPRIAYSKVKQLVRRDEESRFGALRVTFESLQPGTTTWTATVRAGGRTYRLKPLRYVLPGAGSDEVFIRSTKQIQTRLARARSATVTVTVTDHAARELTVERDLRP